MDEQDAKRGLLQNGQDAPVTDAQLAEWDGVPYSEMCEWIVEAWCRSGEARTQLRARNLFIGLCARFVKYDGQDMKIGHLVSEKILTADQAVQLFWDQHDRTRDR